MQREINHRIATCKSSSVRAKHSSQFRSLWARLPVQSYETKIYGAFFAAALVFSGLTAYDRWHAARAKQAERKAASIPIPAEVLLAGRHDFLGESHARYTLVEFGDYECGPCRAMHPSVETALAAHPHDLRFDFREFPLTAIHPRAAEAARSAEAARRNGKFWTVHRLFYTTDLNKLNFAQVLWTEGTGPPLPDDDDAVAKDIALGDKIGVRQTPTFFLCTPEGSVARLVSPDDVSLFVR